MEYSFMHKIVVPNTILIVDDDEMNRDVLGNIFSASHSIEMAENGKECLNKILECGQKFCAVLLDVVMPVMGGIEVLKKLNRDGVVDHIPVFLITGETDTRIIKRAYELGVMDVISKPISSYMVQRRVNSVIELFTARKRLSSVVGQQKDQLLKQAKRILRLNMGMIESLSTAIEFRSGESGEHIRKIHDITKLFLENSPLGRDFSTEEIEHISLAAIMHDVGKISIPDAILSKPGRLTPEEFEIMKKPGRGTNGHIAIGCNNVDRAIYHLSQRGVKFDLDSKNVKNGKTVACYMEGEIAGFAFHLVQA